MTGRPNLQANFLQQTSLMLAIALGTEAQCGPVVVSESDPAYARTGYYGGRPYIWSLLHNFGGGTGMRGNLPTVMASPYAARAA